MQQKSISLTISIKITVNKTNLIYILKLIKIMTQTKNWIGIFSLLLSLPVFAGDINISDPWIRATTQGHENGMVGLTISSPTKARIIAVTSPAYTSTEMRGPIMKKGAKKIGTLKYISLPAKKSFVFGSDNIHFELFGNKKTLRAGEMIPVILTVQFDNKKTTDITFMAQPVRPRLGSAPLPPATPMVMEVKYESPKLVVEPLVIEEPVAAVEEIKISEPIPAPVPEQPSIEPAPVEQLVIAEPVSTPPVAQEAVEPELPAQPETAEALPVEDCLKYAVGINACNQAGEVHEIMNCRKTVSAKLSCSAV